MANGDIPAGWYEEPSGAGGERWWDGTRWTEHVRSVQSASQPAATATAQPAVPAGWYPDPSGGQGQRWWDGARWTEHVHPPIEPATPVEPAPQAPTDVPAGWYPDPSGGQGQRWWDGTRWTAHVHAAAATAEAAPAIEPEVPEVEPEPEPEAEPEPEVPAGWYADPSGGGGLRWWDGTRWTEHVHADDPAPDDAVAEQAGTQVHDESADDAAAAIPSGWYPDPSGDGERWWTGEAWSEQVRATTVAEEGGTQRS